MNRRPSEPLSSEERALADQLARLGPHGEPSAALDARILAAAHDAVVTTAATPAVRRRPRWPLGLGLAASTLLAVGIAWQLRPPASDESQALMAIDAPASSGLAKDSAAPEVTLSEPAAAKAVPPAQAGADLASASEPVAAASTPAHAPAPAPASEPARARTQRTPSPATTASISPPVMHVPAATEYNAPPSQYRVADEPMAFPATAAPPPPAPAPAPVADTADASRAQANSAKSAASESSGLFYEYGRVADQQTMATIAARREQERASQARALSEDTLANHRKEAPKSRASRVATEMAEGVPASLRAGAGAPVAGNSSSVRNTLKRTDLQLPVVEDGKLEPDDWLERIRLRRDLGDRASAGESLRRFKQTHPFQKIPDDLKELIAP